ncbi:MAG: hypothetical protein U0836_18210 [Pirellulales bacterium]
MAYTDIRTYQDLVEYLEDSTEWDRNHQNHRRLRGAIEEAYRDLANERTWSYYAQLGTLNTAAPYSTGTVTYDHTGAADGERLLTLSGGVFPDWASEGTVLINGTPYEGNDRISDTELTLTPASNPGADIATATTYQLFRDTYPLPVNCRAVNRLEDVRQTNQPMFVPPGEWLDAMRQWSHAPGQPMYFTVTGSPDYLSSLAIRFAPPPSTAITFRYMYTRAPRALAVELYDEGVVTVAPGNPTINGTGTAWTTAMIGAVIRFSEGLALPGSVIGVRPRAYERVVKDVTGPTTLVLDSAISTALTEVRYAISDPLDIHVPTMWSVLKKCADARVVGHPLRYRTRDDQFTGDLDLIYREALNLAAQADNRNLSTDGPFDRPSFQPYRVQL